MPWQLTDYFESLRKAVIFEGITLDRTWENFAAKMFRIRVLHEEVDRLWKEYR